jgi:hypothetical protein
LKINRFSNKFLNELIKEYYEYKDITFLEALEAFLDDFISETTLAKIYIFCLLFVSFFSFFKDFSFGLLLSFFLLSDLPLVFEEDDFSTH